jgi:RNA polymerase sigma-70 factor (ECF subfamily)
VAESGFIAHLLERAGIPHRDLPDLTQDVLLAALLAWPDYDPCRPLKPWLSAIAYRIAADYHRLARHAREELGTAEGLDVVDESVDIEEAMTARELARLIRKLSEDLPGDRRSVFVRHDLEGISIPKIAKSMQIPLNTAYSRLRLARRDIRKHLGRKLRQKGRWRKLRLMAGLLLVDPCDGFAHLAALGRDLTQRLLRCFTDGLIVGTTICVTGIYAPGPRGDAVVRESHPVNLPHAVPE